jgi:hypothetical protein
MSQADSVPITVSPELQFDCRIGDSAISGMAIISAMPGGPAWISDLWVASDDGLVPLALTDPRFDVIADAVARQDDRRIAELVDREIAFRDAA